MPTPLHPAVVHFPIVLAVLLPLLTLAGVLLSRRTGAGKGPWVAVVTFAVLLPLAAWGAMATGEQQEDTVEAVVGEAPLHGHEEAAEAFLSVAVVLATVALAGLLPGVAGTVARVASVPVAVLVLGFGYRVGSSGGELVYTHGAASAYTVAAQPADRGAAALHREDENEEREGARTRR